MHRVLCGDATSEADVEKVLAGGLADLTFTDPPYNVNYGQTTAKRGHIGSHVDLTSGAPRHQAN